ncbi:hypothetical protein SAMN02745245_01129 [Anaerosphaera aminiphila DSM 21120]|uniref:Uncharacterized protein n=1 Tax=Anaerosphaera aminiphila DSM 21120 TaxID=1120995 RepID=A0A1M5SCI4_9FIRM|nr:hypothetical protein [Anaerosphaera aminiphila]SHH35613.1 hypothetical protein SAMN02745245_01129 [Anaerosphaera aminiphila DSM 21120]
MLLEFWDFYRENFALVTGSVLLIICISKIIVAQIKGEQIITKGSLIYWTISYIIIILITFIFILF